MLFFTSDLKEYNIDATDGEMGKIKDLYFDDKNWAIRYAIVDTRKWLPGRKVLLSPETFVNFNEADKKLEVEYDKEHVRNSPPIPEDRPVTRDAETSLIGYYGWSRHWLTDARWGADNGPITSAFDQGDSMGQQVREDIPPETARPDYDLRSEEETLVFKVHADDGKIGTVVDFVYDDQSRNIQYIVVQSSENYVDTEFYIYRPEEIESVDWFEQDIYVKDSIASLKQNKVYEKKEDILVER